MAINESIIRGETWRLTIGDEAIFGRDPGSAFLKSTLGVVQGGTMPDPEMDWQNIYALGDASRRNFYINYKGKITLNGSVPDIWPLSGSSLYQGIGVPSTNGTSTTGGASTLNGSTVAGATSIILFSANGYAQNDIIQIDVNSSSHIDECRKITLIVSNTLTLDYPLHYAHLSGADCREVVAPYTHTISEQSTIPSMTIQHELYDSSGTSQLIRRFSGGKVGSMSFSGNEGEELKVSLNDILFTSYKKTGDSGVASVTPSYPTSLPYIFSYAALSFWGTTFARVKSFNLDVSNNLEAKYYLTTGASAYLPYEIREGKREHKLGVKVDITDGTLFNELVKFGINQGASVDGLFKGFDASIVFTRGTNDTITFTLPETSAAAGGDAQGCFIKSAPHNIGSDPQMSVDLDILARSMKIVVVDSNYMPWSS